tara:strand:+ start:850 stop:2094 length:1245 start_codon:yes stop_codon:yes gene_type:complete
MLIDLIYGIFLSIIIFIIIEVIIQKIVHSVRKNFPWLIISNDKIPILSEIGLKKFIPNGFDPELGWIRKPHTSNQEIGKNGITSWSIDENGARTNPNFHNMQSKISCYGDSFTFSRQVNDDETWTHYLSKLTNSNVLNFGVGNYGLDQSLLRLKREFPKNKTQIVIIAVVPETICRILSVWKHYYEYGNTFAFKPKFIIKNDKLIKIENPINNESKFLEYEKYIDFIQNNDYFYKNKFLKEKISFPYCFTILKNLKRNSGIISWQKKIDNRKRQGKNFSDIEWNPMSIIMEINMSWKIKLFKDKKSCKLLKMILQEYVNFSKKMNFKPIFVFLPQKDDLSFIKHHYHFFKNFYEELKSIDGLIVIDIIDEILSETKINDLYSDENDYGGHFSNNGNKIISNILFNKLKNLKLEI